MKRLHIINRLFFFVLLIGTTIFTIASINYNSKDSNNFDTDIQYSIENDENEILLTDQNGLYEEASEIMQDIIEKLFADDDGVVGVKQIFKTIFSGIGYVNSGATFLKLIGIMKDGTGEALAHIQEQLEMIYDKLLAMDAKLDAIISEMAAIKGEARFIARTDAARDYRRYFNDFIRDYCTKGLNPLITDFESMRIDSMKKWYNSSSSDDRVGELFDNSNVILVWDHIESDESEFNLRYHLSNELPEDCIDSSFDGRYLILPSSALPVKSQVKQWHVDTYYDEISSFIYNQLVEHESEITKSGFDASMTDLEKQEAAYDAVNLLVYRTTAEAVNESSYFANSVLEKFNDYIVNLLKDENGFDAALKSLYYTHTFEGEISEVIDSLYESLVFEVGYYGAFVRDVINMSNDISKEKKAAFDDSYSNTIVKAQKSRNKAITGYPNYCYITNTVLYYGIASMSASGQIKFHSSGTTGGFDWHTVNGFSTQLYRVDSNGNTKQYNNNALIGTDASTLISLTLRSNGIVADHDYFLKNLGDGQKIDDYKSIIVTNYGLSDIPFDSKTPIHSEMVIGRYFPADRMITFNDYQGVYDKDYFLYRKQITGQLFDFTTSTITSNAVLAAFAMYGESHWYWSVDEAAFFSGAPYGRYDRSYVRNSPSAKDHIDNYAVSFKHNILIQEEVQISPQNESEGLNSLYTFRKKNNYSEPIDSFLNEPEKIETFGKDSGFNSKVGFYSLIIVPCVVIVIGAGLGTFFMVRGNKKRKNKKAE